MNRSHILEIFSFLFIVLFVYASFNKVFDYEYFTVQVGQSPLLTGLGDFVPPSVILLELVIALMFIFKRTRLVAFFSAFTLMTVFTVYILAILNFSPYVPCSCGGILETMGWREHLIFNISFTALGIVGFLLQWKETESMQPDETSRA